MEVLHRFPMCTLKAEGITETSGSKRNEQNNRSCEVTSRNVLKPNICILRQVVIEANERRCDIVIFQRVESTASPRFIWRAALSPVWEDKVHPDLSSNISSLDVRSNLRVKLHALL